MPTSTLLAPSSPFQIQDDSLGLAWSHRALRLHHLRSSPHHRLSDVPRLPSAGHRRPPSPHPAYARRNLRSLIGPINFSSRIRQRHLQLHRVLGRIYVVSVFVGSFTGIALACRPSGLPGTSMQAAAWMVCTTAAFITARNRQIAVHRQWMARSYAVTFTFVSSRVLNLCRRTGAISATSLRGRRHRLHACFAADRRPRPQLARTHHSSRPDGGQEGSEIFRASS
jgi:uncharacterized membrane protein